MGKLKTACAVLGMISTNCYFAENTETGEVLIIDPADDAFAVRSWCLNDGRKPAAILLTHGHFDHMGAADELRKSLGIQVYAAKAEAPLLASAADNLSAAWSSPVTLKADVELEDGQELFLAGFRIQVIATPGHTAGGLCYYLPEENTLFSGDTLFLGSYGREDFPTSSMADMKRSVKEKLLVLPEDTTVFPGHGEATTIGYEKMYNPLA